MNKKPSTMRINSTVGHVRTLQRSSARSAITSQPITSQPRRHGSCVACQPSAAQRYQAQRTSLAGIAAGGVPQVSVSPGALGGWLRAPSRFDPGRFVQSGCYELVDPERLATCDGRTCPAPLSCWAVQISDRADVPDGPWSTEVQMCSEFLPTVEEMWDAVTGGGLTFPGPPAGGRGRLVSAYRPARSYGIVCGSPGPGGQEPFPRGFGPGPRPWRFGAW